jgi:hypothetical protein
MKSIKNFENKKIENMSNIQGGFFRKLTKTMGSRDRVSRKTGRYTSNTGLFDGARD